MVAFARMRSIEDNNFYQLVAEFAWFGFAFVTVNRFLTLYALRVGATPTELGWILAGPPVGMAVGSVISVWWRNRFPDSVKAMALPAFLFRLSFLMLVFTPLLPVRWQPLWMVFSVSLPALPQGLSIVLFLTMMKETIPDHRITALMSRRTIAVNVALGIGALCFGFWLERAPFPVNYAVMFGLAFAASLVSLYHIMQVTPLDPEAIKPVKRARNSAVRPLQNSRFRQMVIVNFGGHLAFFSIFPIITLRLVEELGATEAFIAAFGVVELTFGALVGVWLARLIHRSSNRKVLALGLLATAVSSVIVGGAPTLSVTLIAAAFGGTGWAIMDITMIGYFTENAPTRDATYYTRVYGQMMWLAMFIAPFIGTQLVEWQVPIVVVLGIGTVLRLLAAAIALADVSLWRSRHITPAAGGLD